MTLYIAENDEKQQIAVVWVKENAARAPQVFDPKKHIFSQTPSDEFFGAPKDAIEHWITTFQPPERPEK